MLYDPAPARRGPVSVQSHVQASVPPAALGPGLGAAGPRTDPGRSLHLVPDAAARNRRSGTPPTWTQEFTAARAGEVTSIAAYRAARGPPVRGTQVQGAGQGPAGRAQPVQPLRHRQPQRPGGLADQLEPHLRDDARAPDRGCAAAARAHRLALQHALDRRAPRRTGAQGRGPADAGPRHGAVGPAELRGRGHAGGRAHGDARPAPRRWARTGPSTSSAIRTEPRSPSTTRCRWSKARTCRGRRGSCCCRRRSAYRQVRRRRAGCAPGSRPAGVRPGRVAGHREGVRSRTSIRRSASTPRARPSA